MTKSLQTAVIGLGSMGYGMAQSLLRSGHVTHGFDVTSSKMDLFMAEGGAPGALSDVAPSLQAVVCVVLNAAQTENVLLVTTALHLNYQKAQSYCLALQSHQILHIIWKLVVQLWASTT